MSKDAMLQAFENYFGKIENLLQGAGAPIVYLETTITAENKWSRDLINDFPDATAYDMRSAQIQVLVKDNGFTSPTKDKWINSEAVITTAITISGQVEIHNHDTTDHLVLIKISKPSIFV